MLKKSTIGRNTRIQTLAKVVDSFVDHCLWQVIPDLLNFYVQFISTFVIHTYVYYRMAAQTCWI